MTGIEVAPGVRIDEVRVGERARKDYGDLTSLKDSILEHGLLQPVVLLPDQHLLCGVPPVDQAFGRTTEGLM